MTRGALQAHLASGATTVSRCWAVDRQDGVAMGFTDHDRDLTFEGRVFRASTGLTAAALEQVTGLAVDNSEASGALTSDGITEADIAAGRYDGAEVRSWLVNWADVSERMLRFRGRIGEIRRAAGAFEAELRGLTDLLNIPSGRVYQAGCSAMLGDASCGVDLTGPDFAREVEVVSVAGTILTLGASLADRPERWFERGSVMVLTGPAAGLVGHVKADTGTAERRIELWQDLRAELRAGDRVRLVAGCDKRVESCAVKFDNILNFRGFPHIPGEDWLIAVPARRRGR